MKLENISSVIVKHDGVLKELDIKTFNLVIENVFAEKAKNMLDKLFEECKHGDDEHQQWLKDKFEDFYRTNFEL